MAKENKQNISIKKLQSINGGAKLPQSSEPFPLSWELKNKLRGLNIEVISNENGSIKLEHKGKIYSVSEINKLIRMCPPSSLSVLGELRSEFYKDQNNRSEDGTSQ